MIIPHYLGHQQPSVPDAFDNIVLRPGEVTEVIYPEDKLSIGRRLVEYTVVVQHRDLGSDTGGARTYRATLGNLLASLPDRRRFLLRAGTPGRDGIGKGSKVIVACISGEHTQAVIVHGLRDPRDSDRGLRDAKLHLEEESNGVLWQVLLDGSARLVRRGPTDLDGKVTSDPEALGSLSLEKDGSVLLGLQGDLDESPDQYVRLDASDGKAKIVADSGLHVGEATDAPIKGSTYREAESTLHADLRAGLQDATTAAAQAGAAATAASTTIAVPTTGPAATAPHLVTIAAQLISLSKALGKMAAALATFEGRAADYLSTKNKSD